VRVAFDEQIFAIQPYGGISRMFAELAMQFIAEPDLGVDLLPLNAPIINRYALEHENLRTRLAVWDAKHEYHSLARYFMRIRPRRRQDIVHNTFYLPHGLASYPGARRIVTVHDMVPELLPKTRRRLDFLTMKKHYVQQADHIVCVSESTKQHLLEVYPKTRAPITVIHHGVGAHFTPHAPALANMPEHYILFVGNRGQYKDADVLLRAFARITNEFPEFHLILVGGGTLTTNETGQLQRLGISHKVQQVSLTDEAMVSAYANAALFVFPSRFEGFGIPILEAMASGAPTLLANSTSLPEVGGDAAHYFEPGNEEDLAESITRILHDNSIQQTMRDKGLARAAQFTWHRAATAHADVYRLTST
jgi:glycosyltransferase involved in cell wall biosynthesis